MWMIGRTSSNRVFHRKSQINSCCNRKGVLKSVTLSGKKKRASFENCKNAKIGHQRVSLSTRHSSSSKRKSAVGVSRVPTADAHLSNNSNSRNCSPQQNNRVTNKIYKLCNCGCSKDNSSKYFSKNRSSNHNEMVDRDISTSSKTDVNIMSGKKLSTTTLQSSSSTNYNPNNNHNITIDQNSNTLSSDTFSNSNERSDNNCNAETKQMTSTTNVLDLKQPHQISTTTNLNFISNQEDVLGDNNNVVSSQIALRNINSESTDVTMETVKKVKKSRKDKERSNNGTSNSKKTRSSDHKKRKVKVAQTDYSTIERTDAEGAASEDLDFENDPEAAEWAKLRCTSQSTEVVQEREQRRQKRCADYPGLAFGRSVFSSDTLMKFSIIRNELHNIMKSQLKRVKMFMHIRYNNNNLLIIF
uniref:CSON013674 protein n=1 Tax=Culicoides sonorensis TaxID=179676 RepID=A0A336LI80_CULSO